MPSVDRRVVEMKFDNAAFERGVAQTMQSLDQLKSKMNFDGAVKGLSNLTNASNKFDLSDMGNSIDTVAAKFSALQVAGVTALATLVNKAVSSGLAIAKSLTVGPIGGGYADYNEKLTSVQTIMSATGKDIKFVNKRFTELDTYADKTIYNLQDMTSAFAKFTNAGIDMDKAIPAIKGIANMTALAGQGAGAAQIAYYNLSQSLSGGFLTQIDYKSLNLANIATVEWKNQMIQGALAAGTLKKSAKGTYSVAGSKEAFTSQSLFTEGLRYQWATTEVLTKVLGDYGNKETEIGAKAQAAAQNVKSLPMMMETLKASVGTGWTDSFEFILGNVEESTKLFTGMTDAIGKVLDHSSQARNHMLHQWKSLGGRTAIIDSVRNSWQALGAILKPIGDAFRSVFPTGGSGQALSDFSYKLREITSHLKIGKETADNLKRTFAGVFSIFKIFTSILGATGKGLLSLFGIVGKGAGGGIGSLLELTARLGDFIVGIQKWLTKTGAIQAFFAVLTSPLKLLKPTLDIVVGLGAALADLATGNFKGFKAKLGGVGKMFKDLFADILDRYHDFAQMISDGFAKIEAFLNNFAKKAKNSGNDAVAGLATAGAKIVKLISQFAGNVSAGLSHLIGVFTGATAEGQNFLKGFGSGAISAVMSLVDRLSGAFDNLRNKMDFSPVLASFSTGVEGASSGASNSLSAVNAVLKAAGDFLSGIVHMFGDVGNFFAPVITAIRDFFTTVIKRVTEGISTMDGDDAIAIFNSGVLVILLLTVRRFLKNFGGMAKDLGGMFANIGGTFDQLKKTLKSFQQDTAPDIIMKIAIAMGILVAALWVLSRIDAGDLKNALLALGGLFAQLAATIVLINKYGISQSGKVAATGAVIIALASAVLLLATAVKMLGGMEPRELANGLEAVGALLAGLGLFTKFAVMDKGGVKAGIGLILMANAINILSLAVLALGVVKFEVLRQGIGAILLLVGAMVLASVAIQKAALGANGIFVMAAALGILIPTVILLGQMTDTSIIRGITGLVVILGALVVAALLMQKAALGANGVFVMAAAIAVLAPAVMLLGQMTNTSIIRGILGLIVILAAVTLAANAMTAALPGAAALLILAGAIAILVPAVMLLGQMTNTSIIRGVLGLAAILAVLIVAIYALTPVIGIMILATKSIALLGAAVLLAGLGFLAFSAGLTALAVTGAAGFAVLVAGVVSFLAILPLIGRQVGYAFGAFAVALGENAPKLIQAFTKIGMEWLRSIQKLVPEFIKTVGIIIEAMIREVVRLGPIWFAAGLDLIIGFLEAIRDRIGEITNLVIDIFTAFIDAVRKRLPNIIQAGIDFLISFMDGLAQGIRERSDEVGRAGVNIATAIIDGIGRGLRNAGHVAREALEELGRNLIKRFREFFGINSPSTKFAEIGGYLIEGLANGISGAWHYVVEALQKVYNKLPAKIRKMLELAQSVLGKVVSTVGGVVAQGLNDSSRIVSLAGEDLGSTAMDGVSAGLSRFGEGLFADMDTAPVIRPVLDLSDVEANAGRVGSLLSVSPLRTDVAYANAQSASSGYSSSQAAADFNATQMRKALQTLAAIKPAQVEGPRPVEFHIGTVQDGDSLLQRARATNKMLALSEGGDSTQMMGLQI